MIVRVVIEKVNDELFRALIESKAINRNYPAKRFFGYGTEEQIAINDAKRQARAWWLLANTDEYPKIVEVEL